MHLGVNPPALQRLHLHAAAGDHGHLAGFEEDHPAGMLENGGDIGGDEHLAFAQTDDHPAGIPDPGRDDLIRFAGRHDDHAVRSFEQRQGPPDGFHQASIRRIKSVRSGGRWSQYRSRI